MAWADGKEIDQMALPFCPDLRVSYFPTSKVGAVRHKGDEGGKVLVGLLTGQNAQMLIHCCS